MYQPSFICNFCGYAVIRGSTKFGNYDPNEPYVLVDKHKWTKLKKVSLCQSCFNNHKARIIKISKKVKLKKHDCLRLRGELKGKVLSIFRSSGELRVKDVFKLMNVNWSDKNRNRNIVYTRILYLYHEGVLQRRPIHVGNRKFFRYSLAK